jgi:hypothetical protein
MAQGSPPNNIIGQGRFPPAPTGSGPHDPGTEARLAALEAAVTEIRADLKAIRLDLAELKGKLSNVPTTFQLVFMQGTIIIAVFAGAIGLSFALMKFASGY